jgi:predicted GTPase
VVSVLAVRTGAGKSPLSQAIAAHLGQSGLRVAVVRHPMPYGDLERQRVQRFATPSDLERAECTLEEREEYEPYLERGLTVWAGVDYARLLEAAERESDVIVWDGGNNDRSFFASGLTIVVVDALRPGHEISYYPGETNFRQADVIVVNKVAGARPDDLSLITANLAAYNPRATVVESDLRVHLAGPEQVRGRRALVVEDGPTLTHGGMSHGAGWLAARQAGASEIIDPRPHAVGSIRESYARFPQIGPVLPALGYSAAQRDELRQTIVDASPDVVVDASPARLNVALDLEIPTARVSYAFQQRSGPPLLELVEQFVRTSRAAD